MNSAEHSLFLHLDNRTRLEGEVIAAQLVGDNTTAHIKQRFINSIDVEIQRLGNALTGDQL